MARVTNTGRIVRGVVVTEGDKRRVVRLQPGASIEAEFDRDYLGRLSGREGFKVVEKAAEPGPLDQSVDKLTAYLERVTDVDEVQRLIEAETAGKSRDSALKALEARRDALLA